MLALEPGCGYGRFVERLLPRVRMAFGIDTSQGHWGLAFLAVSVVGGELLTHVVRYIQNSPSEVRRGSRAPLHFGRVYRSNVPENTVTLATKFVRTRKLPFQFPGNKVVFVPKLHNS